MVIIKISEKTVQCNIAPQELYEIGLTPDEVINDMSKSVKLMTRINKEVGDKLDYDPENEVMMLTKNKMPDGGIRIFAVKMDNDDIQSSADRIKQLACTIYETLSQDKIDAIKNAKGNDKNIALENLIADMNDMVGNVYMDGAIEGPSYDDNTTDGELEVTTVPAIDYQRYMTVFDNIDHAYRFSKVVSNLPIVDSTLYKMDGVFYLAMGLKTESENNVYELRRAGIEYANSLAVNTPREQFIEENAEVVIADDAIYHLSQMA